MASYNRVILMGNLTRDPQLRYLPNNTAVCDFGLATNRRYRDRDGNQKEEVCFVDVTAWGRQAENINQYVTKGRPLLVEGRLKLDQWTAQDGQKRSKLTVVVDNFQFVGGREGGGAPAGGPPREQHAGAPQHDSGPPQYDSGPPHSESGPGEQPPAPPAAPGPAPGPPEGQPPSPENIPF